jgi:hypothetical protein
MNGHKQSGGHWNAAFGLARCGSGGLGSPQESSRSGDGSASGTLFIVLDASPTAWRSRPSCCATRGTAGDGGDRVSSFAFDYPLNLQVGLFLVCSVLLRFENFEILTAFFQSVSATDSSRIPCNLCSRRS